MESFKEALYEVVHRSSIPAKQLPELIGLSYSMIMNAANPNLEEFNLRGDKIVPLTIQTKNHALVDYINKAIGLASFPLPSPAPDSKPLHTHLTKTVSEFSDVLKTFDEMMSDNKVRPCEAAALEKEAYELIQALMAWVATVKVSAGVKC